MMVWLLLKPVTLAAGRTVAPEPVAVRSVGPPAVPTPAMMASSRFAPESIRIVWPALKPSTLETLMFVAPAGEAVDRAAAACARKSLQMPSGLGQAPAAL